MAYPPEIAEIVNSVLSGRRALALTEEEEELRMKAENWNEQQVLMRVRDERAWERAAY